MLDMTTDMAVLYPSRHDILHFNAYCVSEVMSGTCRKISGMSGAIAAKKYRPNFRKNGFKLIGSSLKNPTQKSCVYNWLVILTSISYVFFHMFRQYNYQVCEYFIYDIISTYTI